MTALTMPARPQQDAGLRPLPWQRMGWVTWRQHRTALAGAAVLLAALAIYLWITGLRLHHAYAVAIACHPASSFACVNMLSDFNSAYWPTAETIAGLLQVVPPLIGAFVGAPVLARELETGTFRFAWTQGFGRSRWTLAKLVLLAVAVTAAAGLFSILFSWYYQPFFAEQQQTPFDPSLFNLRGVAFAAWTLAAFAIGALAGMLIRRVVPAIAATLAVYAGLTLGVGLYLRQHYMTPLVTSNPNVPGSAWVISQWWTKGGQPVSQATINQVLQAYQPAATKIGPNSFQKTLNPVQYLIQHGYAQWTSYQPVSRFWPFQWIEGGWLVALSVLLIAATVWLVRRRAA
jgi:ABC-type transport system involved in multi-copper enzyme maturation permease subunit